MPKFKDYDKQAARKKLPELNETEQTAKAFYDGDHWQGGFGWVGPSPKPGNPELMFIMAQIARQFVSRNAIAAVVDRHASALIAKEPSWSFVTKRMIPEDGKPTEEETKQIELAEKIVSEWWDRTRALEKLKAAAIQSLVVGRGSLRVFVPTGRFVRSETDPSSVGLKSRSLEEDPLVDLFVETTSATVFVDEDTMDEASVFVKKDEAGREIVEFCYVDGDSTYVKTWDDKDQPSLVSLPLGGKLTVKQIKRKPIVSTQMMSSQKSLNMSLTMLDRNSIQGGFLERVILNAEPPGEWSGEPGSPDRKFTPRPLTIGAGLTTFLTSKTVNGGADGDPPTILPVDIRWRDPVNPETFIKTAAEHRYGVYEEARQLHALMGGDATASGVSRIQARADFLDSLADTKPQVDEAVRWLMDMALDHACYFAGTTRDEQFPDIRPSCDLAVSTGPLDAEERKAVMEMIDAEMLSLEVGMQLLGVDDVDGERSRIKVESDNPTPGRQLKKMETFAKIGYRLAEDQLGDLDDDLGLPKRDVQAVAQEQADAEALRQEQVRAAKAANEGGGTPPAGNA
jgi:hypothetical protein